MRREAGTAAKALVRMAYAESSGTSVWMEPEVDRMWPDSLASHGLQSGLQKVGSMVSL